MRVEIVLLRINYRFRALKLFLRLADRHDNSNDIDQENYQFLGDPCGAVPASVLSDGGLCGAVPRSVPRCSLYLLRWRARV